MQKVKELTSEYRTIRNSKVEICRSEDDVVLYLADCIDELETISRQVGLWDKLKNLVRRSKRFLFHLRAAPVPSDFESIVPDELTSLVDRYLEVSGQAFPPLEGPLKDLKMAYLDVRTRKNYNPLLDTIIEEIGRDTSSHVCLVLKDKCLIPYVEEVTSKTNHLQGIEAIEYRDARRSSSYDERLFVGNPSWYPKHMFEVPISIITKVFLYDWERGAGIDMGIDIDESVRISGPFPKLVRHDGDQSEGGVDIEEIDPITNWDRITGDTSRNGGNDEEDQVRCRVFKLARDWAVFIPSGERNTAQVVELHDAGSPVNRKEVGEIGIGDYMLLRTEGGGDLVEKVADALMGEKKERLRRIEKQWQNGLKRKVEKKGMTKVLSRLVELGGTEKVRKNNLRNWVSGTVICPSSKKDMNAILDLIDFQEDLDTCWRAMQDIRTFHRKAGRKIRDALIERVTDTDIDDLEVEGIKKIDLGDREGGEIGIFRVEEVSPDEHEVTKRRTRTPFRLS